MNERMKERQTEQTEQKANEKLIEMTKQNNEKISDDLTKILAKLDELQGVRS